MPDSPGFHSYDGPAQMPLKPVFLENAEHADQDSDKKAKRARRQSMVPRDNSVLPPITEDTHEHTVAKPITNMEKKLWREEWERREKPGSLENFALQKKVAMLHSDIIEGNGESLFDDFLVYVIDRLAARPRTRYIASAFDQLTDTAPEPASQAVKRKRHQSNTAQPLVTANDLSLFQPSMTSNIDEASSARPRRTSRTSNIPKFLAGAETLMGKEFLAATKVRSVPSASQTRHETINTNRTGHYEDDEDEEPQTPGGTAASTLLQAFGSRKIKISKKVAK